MTETTTTARSTDAFRKVQRHLIHVTDMVGSLRQATPVEAGHLMQAVVSFFESEIRPHTEWEEEVLYPIIDEKAGGPTPVTCTMRRAHAVIGRWIASLARERDNPVPDTLAFARKADNLLGLLVAHCEEEEEVLLPILDRTMTHQEFHDRVETRLRKHR
jgi:iron-sulfur cluster repair protein YtfE (RIC family)